MLLALKAHTGNREDGFTIMEIVVAIGLLAMLTVMVMPALKTLITAEQTIAAQDSTSDQSPVAQELRSIHTAANRCALTFTDNQAKEDPYYLGERRGVVITEDISDCLANIPGQASTLRYEVKRGASGVTCVVGYDNIRDTDIYNVESPYIYYAAKSSIYDDATSPCGKTPTGDNAYDWSQMMSRT